jgi:hypothetical protein
MAPGDRRRAAPPSLVRDAEALLIEAQRAAAFARVDA